MSAAPEGSGARAATSFWLDDLVAKGLDDLAPRDPLPGEAHADVCIIGAGFTGLWTAIEVLAVRSASIERPRVRSSSAESMMLPSASMNRPSTSPTAPRFTSSVTSPAPR